MLYVKGEKCEVSVTVKNIAVKAQLKLVKDFVSIKMNLVG
jgi:hypothetical protein